MKKFLAKFKILFLIFLLSLPAFAALLIPGYFGASDDMHIAWLSQIDKLIKIGKFPPRFVPDLSFGFGYPLFNFVFPFPFYLGELFHLLGFNLVDSVKAVLLISIPLSMITMYLLLREFSNRSLSILGAVIYIYAPYRATDIYVRGAIGEVFAFVFLPLVALSIIKVSKDIREKGKLYKWIGLGGFSISLLILTHNIISYMYLPFILLLSVLYLVYSKRKIALFKSLSFTFILGLLGSIYFWLPALIESKLVKYDTVFNYWDHFPTVKQLLIPYFGYGASVPGPYDGMSFFVGFANLAVILLAIIALALSKLEADRKIIVWWGLTMFFISFFIMNHRSQVIWENIPYLAYFQFPWRFLALTTFSSSLLIIALTKENRLSKILIVIFVLLIVLTNFSYFRPQDFLGRKDDYYLNRYIPVPIISNEYRTVSEEYLRLPKGVLQKPDQLYPRVDVNPNPISISVYEINDLDAKIDTEVNQTTVINYNKYNFPGWVVVVNGKDAGILTGKPFGQVSFELPAGKHNIEVYYKETYFRSILDIISLITFSILIVLIFSKKNLKKI